MIKIEKECYSLKADVMHKGEKIGHMESVRAIQWFVTNKYRYTGEFSRFITKKPSAGRSGITVDIIIPDKKLVVKDAFIEWVRSPGNNGTFHASSIKSQI